ncbi:hypothetical protein F4779DRAFT_574335 [Xylariaceae sp. FL0662B]|nr:hypothetical protein F4779DRAFT_574335 [Xylariaceae sp. FL0662B]
MTFLCRDSIADFQVLRNRTFLSVKFFAMTASRPPPHPRLNHAHEVDFRSRQLDKFFYNIVEGRWRIGKFQDAQSFLEAIVNTLDKLGCIERLASSKNAQDVLRKSLTFNNSDRYINSHIYKLLVFLADLSLKRVCDGELLNQILWTTVNPPLFWNKFVQNIRNRRLEAQASSRGRFCLAVTVASTAAARSIISFPRNCAVTTTRRPPTGAEFSESQGPVPKGQAYVIAVE